MLRVLEQASDIVKRKWNNSSRGWKILLIVGLIFLSLILLVCLLVWLLGRFIKSLTEGAYRNRSLYIPRVRR